MSLLSRVLPRHVAHAEAYDDRRAAPLFPVESAAIQNAAEARRREFATTRGCARRALLDLGFEPQPIRSGRTRAPIWPPGVVGSLTHCRGFRGAAAARAVELRGVGIDAEPHDALTADVLGVVALEEELAATAELRARWPTLHWDRILFSAKESVFKVWFPLTGRWLDFSEASIAFNPADRSFTVGHAAVDADPEIRGVLGGMNGRFVVSDGLVVTGVTIDGQSV